MCKVRMGALRLLYNIQGNIFCKQNLVGGFASLSLEKKRHK